MRNGGEQMDKKKGLLNISVSVGFKLITMFFVIFVKRILIDTCGNEINGLNSLYLNIIGFLAVAELGVGNAITFCMYEPIVNGDNDKVSALYGLFHKCYLTIAAVITLSGFVITPFLSYFAKDYTELDVNLYLTFILMLISVVLTYAFASKTSLINAYKNNYITNAISSGGLLLQYALQVLVLILTKSFIWYLICRIITSIVKWIITEWIARKKYSNIIRFKHKIDSDTKVKLIRSIKAMFMHKIGTVLVNTVDSVVISMFVGVIALGEYSNYLVIATSLVGVINLVFTSLVSVLGHMFVESDKTTSRKHCETFHLLNFIIGIICFLGYYAIIDDLIAILFSSDLIVSKSISIVITVNSFVQFMRQSTLSFREATGTFYNDRWKPLFEGLVNLVLSVIFVKWFGVTGVIVATIITNLLICHIIEPFVLYKNAFLVSPKRYYFKNYSMIAAFIVALLALDFVMMSFDNRWKELLVNGFISVGISCVVIAVFTVFQKDTLKRLFKR